MTDELPSKSQRKRDMHALQDLGTELAELNDEQLASVELPESLRDAVLEARRLAGKHEARRRQMQYVGKLMRHIDPEPIRASIDAYKAVSREATARLHMLERGRTRLLEDDDALTEFMNAYPKVDAARVRMLLRNAERERARQQGERGCEGAFHFDASLLFRRNHTPRVGEFKGLRRAGRLYIAAGVKDVVPARSFIQRANHAKWSRGASGWVSRPMWS